MVNTELSKKYSRHSEVSQCYKNAVLALQRFEELREGYYVEGFAVMDEGSLLEHGWIELNGLIIDVTIPDKAVTMKYFPVERFSRNDLSKMLAETKYKLPLFHRYNFNFPIEWINASKQSREEADKILRSDN